MSNIYDKALRVFGAEHQINKAKEELFECGVELSHYNKKQDRRALASEIADVEIVLGQIKKLFFLEAFVQEAIDLKLSALDQLCDRIINNSNAIEHEEEDGN